ncbi:6-phosphofructo-2-kinase-domain-containing protein [Cladochytrium replicatum]|nr:6-phosphofructo-2-kinase-domain-containing protein [Cladochytrium replicatum]
MVGLPARGKSYICKKLTRYLSWCGYNTKVFNVGNKRRTSASTPHPPTAPTLSLPAEPPAPARTPSTSHNASFFDPQNAEARALRDQMAMEVVDEMLEWLNNKQGKVAVHDATNSNIERRRALVERVKREKNSVCTDPAILEQNIRMKTKGPDYAHMPEEDAIRDFKARMVNYEKAYEGLGAWEENEDISYIKIYNVGKKVVAYNIKGFLQSQCVFYLMQIHIRPRMIWLTRHGESVYNVNNRIGGDPPLTENGRKYGAALLKFVQKFHPPPVEPSPISSNPALDEMVQSPVTSSSTEDEDDVLTIAAKEQDAVVPSGSMNLAMYPRKTLGRIGLQTTSGETSRRRGSLDVLETMEEGRNLSIWTSTLRRTVETVAEVDAEACEVKHVRALNEIHAGFCENLTYKEIERNYPQEFASRRENKLTYRYPGPGGESYIDVIERLRPVIIELERMDTNVLIVTHNVVMRTLLTYFLGIPLEEMPNKQIPLHTVYCLQPKPYGADLVKYQYDADTDDFVDVGSSV